MPIDDDVGTRRRAWRFAAAVSTAFLIVQFFGWQLAFLLPVFVGMLVVAPSAVSFRAAISLMIVVAIILLAGNLAAALLSYPLFFVVLLIAGLFGIFSIAANGGSPLLVVMMLIAILLVPLVAQSSLALAGDITFYIWFDLFVAILLSWLFFGIVPNAPEGEPASGAPAADPKTARYGAIAMTGMVVPLALAFISFGWTSVLTLLFATLLIQQLSTQEDLKGAYALLAANGVGALLAIVVYLLIAAAPGVFILSTLIILVTLYAATLVTKPAPKGGLWMSAFNSFLVILGASLAPYGDDAGAKGFSRVLQIGAACMYVSFAIMVMEGLFRRRQTRRLPVNN
jgi:hypothetical protein